VHLSGIKAHLVVLIYDDINTKDLEAVHLRIEPVVLFTTSTTT
jgi:hypothetical protein